jgi:hypothetical protein
MFVSSINDYCIVSIIEQKIKTDENELNQIQKWCFVAIIQ